MRLALLVAVALAAAAVPARAQSYQVTGVGCSAFFLRDPLDARLVDVVVTGGPVAVLPPGAVGLPATEVVVHCDVSSRDDAGEVVATTPVASVPGVVASVLPPTLVRVPNGTAYAPLVCGSFTWREPDGSAGSFPTGCAAAQSL